MGYNRSGHVRKQRLKRAKRLMARLARKAATQTAATQPAPAGQPAQG